jgi:hypothetical protein
MCSLHFSTQLVVVVVVVSRSISFGIMAGYGSDDQGSIPVRAGIFLFACASA